MQKGELGLLPIIRDKEVEPCAEGKGHFVPAWQRLPKGAVVGLLNKP